MPVSHPEMNGPAIAKTSCGSRGRSKAVGIDVASFKTLRMVWWRASTVTIDAAAVRMVGSETRCAAPRYAATPTFSTSRATGAIAETLVRTAEKSKVHPEIGVPPRAVIVDCNLDGELHFCDSWDNNGPQ